MQIKLLLVLALTAFLVSAQQCHYSCSSCSDGHYTNCQTCSASIFKPLTSTSSGVFLGICAFPAYTTVNGLGLVLILLSIAVGLFLKSQHIFYFIISFQTFGLMSLMEVAYQSSLTTLLDSFQYLMVFSKMQQNSKVSDGVLISRKMYRLQAFLTTAQLKQNITPLFVVSFLVAVLLVIFLLIKKFRNGRIGCLSEERLDTILAALRTILLLTMQQMLLIYYVGIRFGQLGGSQIVLILFYSGIMVFLLVDLNFHRVPYFKAKKLLNLVIAQRLLLPVMVILPYADTHHLIIFMNAFAIIELIFLAKSGASTRHYVYSAIKLAVCVFLGIYVAVQLGLNSSSSSRVASIFAIIALVAFIVAFLVQIVLSLKDQCCGGGSKVKNQEQLVRTKTNQFLMVRQDTMADDSIKIKEARQTGHVESHKQKDVNILSQPKRQEKKFKVGKK